VLPADRIYILYNLEINEPKRNKKKMLVVGLNKENGTHVLIFLGCDLYSAWQVS
jgi:hypothetical protein